MSQISSLSKLHSSSEPYQSRHLIRSRMNWHNLSLDTLIALWQYCCTTPFTFTTPDAKSQVLKLYLAEQNVTFLPINETPAAKDIPWDVIKRISPELCRRHFATKLRERLHNSSRIDTPPDKPLTISQCALYGKFHTRLSPFHNQSN